jgi:hypothetical protein
VEVPVPATPYTQQDLLDILDTLFPQHWLAALKSPGPGYELLQAAAQLGAVLSQAATDMEQGFYLLEAGVGAQATTTVVLTRPTNANGAVTVLAGSLLVCRTGPALTRDGDRTPGTLRVFVLGQDVDFGALDLTGTPNPATAYAIGAGAEYNVPGPVTAASTEVLAGDIDAFANLIVQNAAGDQYADPTIVVTQVTAATGGADPYLLMLGDDRGLPRLDGEPVANYRNRLRQLADTVSMGAIERAAAAALAPYGVAPLAVIETWRQDYQTCYDGPLVALGSAANPGGAYAPGMFVLDDEGCVGHDPNVAFSNRMLDTVHQRNGIIVWVPDMPAVADSSMAYDDPGVNPADFATPAGYRAWSALDVPVGAAAVSMHGALDGFDLQKAAAYKGLLDTLNRVKAHGVMVAIELQGQ